MVCQCWPGKSIYKFQCLGPTTCKNTQSEDANFALVSTQCGGLKSVKHLMPIAFFCYSKPFISYSGQIPKGEDLIVKDDIVQLKRCIFAQQVSSY